MSRHEILRTTYRTCGGKPVATLQPPPAVPIKTFDLRSFAEADPESRAFQLAAQEALRPFDLAHDLTLRASLIRLGDEEYFLVLVFHSIAYDGDSQAIALRDLAAFYNAIVGDTGKLPDLPLQYSDFADQYLPPFDVACEQELAFWKQRLARVTEALSLPTDRSRPVRRSFRGARKSLALGDHLSKRLTALATGQKVPLFVVLLSAFQTLLHRYSGSDDIVVGSPFSFRTIAAQQLIGNFSNLLPLRTDFSRDPTFNELLYQVRDTVIEARDQKKLPFDRLVEALQANSSASHTPLLQTTFEFHDQPEQPACFDGLEVEELDFDRGTSEFELSLRADLQSDKLVCTLTYNIDLFDSVTIQRTLGHLEVLLDAATTSPETRVSQIPILTQAEQHRTLVEWNETRVDFPQTCAHLMFEEQVRKTPEAVALVYENRQLTYAELNANANRLAHCLRNLGLGPDVMVGICIERSVELVIGILAILKAGGAYAPLDPIYPPQRLEFMLSDLQAPVLLCRKPMTDGLSRYTRTVLPVEEWSRISAGQSAENPLPASSPSHVAYVLDTSGSTGKPKGVLIPHRALTNYLAWCMNAYAVDQGCGSPVHTPIGFDLTITSLFPPLLVGRTTTLVREDASLETMTTALRAAEFSLVKLTPSHLETLRHALSTDDPPLPALMFVIGGEALLGESLSFWRKQSPGIRLINEYGPTEATVGCCVYEVPAGPIPSTPVPIGRPIANVRLFVLDRNLQPVPAGVPGELHIGGDSLALGYHRRPELTARKFIPDPFSSRPGDRLYKTGDLVRYRSDGNLEFLGRMDHQVKIRGFRIELSEIEAALAEHPGVRDVVVAAPENTIGGRRLVAYVVPQDRAALSPAQLRSLLKRTLPDYMLPAAYVFLETLPLTANGKVDRDALPLPDPARDAREDPLDTPRDELELQLSRIWEEILSIRPVGVTEDFFDLGGNSLLAIRMLARVDKMLGRKLRLGTLFQASTIEQLAAMLRRLEALEQPRVFGIQPRGWRPPFFCVGAGPMFRPLAHALGFDQPFLGVPLPEAHVLTAPFRMEQIAQHCVKSMIEAQKEGPYFLGGWSDAGLIAYEIAQQLRQQGREVALLVLFDAENPARLSDLPALDSLRSRIFFLGQWVTAQCRTVWQLEPRELSQHLRERLSFRVSWAKGHMWSVAYRLRLHTGWRASSGLQSIEDVSSFVARVYVPRPYDGRVLLFRRSDRPTGLYRDPKYGWGGLVDKLEIHEIPGNHMAMFLDAGARLMAEKLRDHLLHSQHLNLAASAAAGRNP